MQPLPIDQRVRFFVFVIESPSPVDLYHRRSEGEIIRQAVELNGIKCFVKTAITPEAFEACLKIGLSESMEEMPSFLPILHISTHGDTNGLQLSNGYLLNWDELKEHLRPVNKALGGSLVVCISSCEGYSGVKMAMSTEEKDLPFLAIIGCGGKPTWGETAVGYATLYHQLWRGEHIANAVSAMCVASGNKKFYVQHAERSRQDYIDYINTINTVKALASLEAIVAHESPENKENLKRLSKMKSNE